MKKIVGILAAAAVLATSVFAVDFTAGFQLKADLFNFNGEDESIGAMQLKHDNSKDDKPFIFSVSGEKAGGSLKFYDAGGTGATAMTANYWNIWFKPFDVLKVELGAQDIKLNCEQVTWWKGKVFGAGDWGYKAAYEGNGLTIAAALLPGQGNYWMSKAKDGDLALAETAFFAQYSADFGTIKVLFDGKNTFKDIMIGAGYNNKFGDVSMFVDFAFGKNMLSFQGTSDANKVGNAISADVDAKYAKDAISAEAYVGFLMNLDNKSDNMQIPVYAKFAYNLDVGGTAFLKFEDNDLMAKKFVSTITAGYDGNMGALAYEVAAAIDTTANGKVKFSMPTWFKLSF